VTIKNSFGFQPDLYSWICGNITAAVCKSVSSLFGCLYRSMDLHCHFHTLPLLFRLFLLFYRHFLSIETCKNLLFKGRNGDPKCKGNIRREEPCSYTWRTNRCILESEFFPWAGFLLLPNPLHWTIFAAWELHYAASQKRVMPHVLS